MKKLKGKKHREGKLRKGERLFSVEPDLERVNYDAQAHSVENEDTEHAHSFNYLWRALRRQAIS